MKRLLLIPILFLFACTGDSTITNSNNLSQSTGEIVFDGSMFYATKFKVDSIEYIVIKSKTDGSVAVTKHN